MTIFLTSILITKMTIRDHFNKGKHFGFRLCDIIYFCSLWKFIYWLSGKVYGFEEKRAELKSGTILFYQQTMMQRPGINYVECPICYLFKVKAKKLKNCNCDSSGIKI